LDLVATRCPQVLETVAAQVAAAAGFFTGKNTVIRVVIFDYEGKPLGKIWANPL
jgi:hypothetical protein